MTYKEFVFLGLGGGWRTAFDMAVFTSYFMPEARLILVDGGTYDSRQLDHEHFLRTGNKAVVQAEFLNRECPEVNVDAVSKYVGTEDDALSVAVDGVVTEGSVVFVLVDNNRTRRLVCDHADTLNDVTVLCGGTNNDQLRTNIHIRRGGVDLTTPLPEYLSSVADPTDQAPFEIERENCTDRLGERERFHPFTMLATSTMLCNAFYEVWRRESDGTLHQFPYDQMWFDIRTGRSRTEQFSRTERR